MTSEAVQILIQQLDLKVSFNEDKDLFNKEMKRILQAIAENYLLNGMFKNIAENEQYYKHINGSYVLTEEGFGIVLKELISSLNPEK